MPQWVEIAHGASFEALQQTIADRDLPAGTEVMLQMTTSPINGPLFDSPLAEPLMRQKLQGYPVTVDDVWYESGFAYARLYVTNPVSISNMVVSLPWRSHDEQRREEEDLEGKIGIGFLGILAIIGLVVLGGILISMLVSFIRVTAAITDAVVGLPKPILIALGIGAVVGISYLLYKSSKNRSFEVGPQGFRTEPVRYLPAEVKSG